MAIRAAGEHKQRITINVTIDGLRLRDEKTGDSLYHHPVHKISFIAQDMTDSRAFGYIFGSPDSGHRFFGIKTDKAANQVRMSLKLYFPYVLLGHGTMRAYPKTVFLFIVHEGGACDERLISSGIRAEEERNRIGTTTNSK